jgi:hypothetical protein
MQIERLSYTSLRVPLRVILLFMCLHLAEDQPRGTINSSLKCAKTGCNRGTGMFEALVYVSMMM